MKRYERRVEKIAPPGQFARRLALSLLWGLGFILLSLCAGMLGYKVLEGQSWLDAFLNASMLLAGMGPLHAPLTDGGKLFAGLYALYSGFAVLIGAAIMFAPIVHRALHQFHLDEEDTKSRP